jgi:hypothetical protein
MNRLDVVESLPSTGGMADHRFAMRRRTLFGCRRNPRRDARRTQPTAPPWLPALVRDLRGHVGPSLVLAAEFLTDRYSIILPAEALIPLGTHTPPNSPKKSLPESLAPCSCWTAIPSISPRGHSFRGCAPQVSFSVHHGLYADETAAVCRRTCQICMPSKAGATRSPSRNDKHTFSRSSSRSTMAFPGTCSPPRRNRGRDKVYVAVFEENRIILDVLELISERNVLTVPTISVGTMILGTIRILARMRWLGIDAAIDLEFLLGFCRDHIPQRSEGSDLDALLLRPGLYRGDLMTHRMLFNHHLRTSEMFWTVVEALGFPANTFPAFNLRVTEASDEAILLKPVKVLKRAEGFTAFEARLRQLGDQTALLVGLDTNG